MAASSPKVWSFFTQVFDVGIDGSVITRVIISMHHVQKLIPAVNPSRSFHHDFEQAKLVGSEVDGWLLHKYFSGFRVEPNQSARGLH